ncbi:MAG TPA: helix-turn-helix transcriptional regulator [Propionibacteriaceae bacterium]|nr:helix-turn-helix transcriptional regulator [Propionibacteriaceae bacterium]
MAKRSPTVRERRLARALRHLREEAGLTIEEIAEKLEMSASTVSRMETAQVGVRPRDLKFLLDMYEVSEAERDQLLQIARERRQQRWWREYADLPSILFAGLEEDASAIWQYSTQLIPGLLQSEAYARAVLQAIRLDAKPGDVERRLELRVHRQELLTSEHAPEYWVVLDEAVVLRQVGGPAVMADQLGELIEAARRPNVTLQVLPFTSGEHAGMDGEFTVFHYLESADPDVVYIENTGSDLYLEAPEVTRRYSKIFDHLRAAAQNPAESIRTLGGIQSELHSS